MLLQAQRCFAPQDIFENGQAFRFGKVRDGVYEGVAHGRFLRVTQRPDGVFLYPCEARAFEEIWRHFFDLDICYEALFEDCDDAALRSGIAYAPGLRILNQQPFETLISFILSANNHDARIRSLVDKICSAYGAPFSFEGNPYHAFPEPQALAQACEADLRTLGVGYRAPYLIGASRSIAEGFDLDAVAQMDYAAAKRRLMELPGVGAKVADCILLFSLSFREAFPADVWVRRILQDTYDFCGNDKQIFEFAQAKFGACAGIAQQYLFHHARESAKQARTLNV